MIESVECRDVDLDVIVVGVKGVVQLHKHMQAKKSMEVMKTRAHGDKTSK
jgi:hypothetical protein